MFRRDKVRTRLRTPSEVADGHNREFFHNDVPPLERFWLYGDVLGVGLSKRGRNDDHIIFTILSGDDGAWSVGGSGASSYYLPDFIALLEVVNEWLERNGVPDMHDGYQYGWRFP